MSPRKPITFRKEILYQHPIESVWTALTDPRALAEWLMPNNFKPIVGHKFRFMVDPVKGIYSGIQECEVKVVEPPRLLVYTWVVVPAKPSVPRPEPMTLTWRLIPEGSGTRLELEQTGLENIGWWSRVSMKMGWGRMLNRLLPRVLSNVEGSVFTPGAITKRDYGTKTVPDDYAK